MEYSFQYVKYPSIVFHFEFLWTRKCNHAGVALIIGLLGRFIEFRSYDPRHYKDGEWMK